MRGSPAGSIPIEQRQMGQGRVAAPYKGDGLRIRERIRNPRTRF